MPNYYIFRCSDDTYQECIDRMLVGQKESNQSTPVDSVRIGNVIFLHKTSKMSNVSSQFMEGPFFAVSNGQKNMGIR